MEASAIAALQAVRILLTCKKALICRTAHTNERQITRKIPLIAGITALGLEEWWGQLGSTLFGTTFIQRVNTVKWHFERDR